MKILSQKKILIFTHDASLYGASLSLLAILEHLSKDKSVDILLVLPYGGKIEERLVALKINYKIIPFPRCDAPKTDSLKIKIRNILLYYKRVYKISPILKALSIQFKPDLVYTNTSVVSIGYRIARKIHVPHIWHIREFFEPDHHLSYLPFRKIIACQIRKSDSLIFASAVLRKLWVGLENDKYRVIYNGIALESHNNEFKLPSRIFKFGLLGYLVPGKGHDIAIRGFSNLLHYHPNSELHFYGDTSDPKYFQDLQKLISESGCIEKVFFHTYIEDNRSIYKDIHVLLSCSKFEGVGRTIVEAMWFGIPVIVNLNKGNCEIIDDKITGLLYPNTPESLSEKMNMLLSDSILYCRLSKNAIIKAHKEFTIEEYVNKVSAVLKTYWQ